jgi:hypothetical protein
MKKLINKKTGEVAYLNEENNTIYFSKTKTTHNATIITNPQNEKITKIIASEEVASEPNPELKTKSTSNTNNNEFSNLEMDPINDLTPSYLFPEMEYFEELPESTKTFPEIAYHISA